MIELIPIIILTSISLINLIYGPYLKKTKVIDSDLFISILIPAKNEINRIDNCLKTISLQNYPNYEVIVYDDNSIDGTYEYVKNNYPNIMIIQGKEKPMDWKGKNWACWNLSQHAKGEIIIFTDADNYFEKDLIALVHTQIQKNKLDALSVFPEIKNVSFSEKIFVPIVDTVLYSLLPLNMIYKTKNSSITAANGQLFAFKKDFYFKIGGHQSSKESFAEDVLLSKMVKKNKGRLMTFIGNDVIYTRMYDSFQGIWNGFSKNSFYIMGGSIINLLIFNFLLIFSTITIFFTEYVVINLILLLIWQLTILIIQKNDIKYIVFFPFRILFIFANSLFSFYIKQSGKVKWK